MNMDREYWLRMARANGQDLVCARDNQELAIEILRAQIYCLMSADGLGRVNIQATLVKCRAELRRQLEMEEWATQPPWHRRGEHGDAARQCVTGKVPTCRADCDQEEFVAKGEESTVVIMGYAHGFSSTNLDLLCLARNLFPARLMVVNELLDLVEYYAGLEDPILVDAGEKLALLSCALLGVEAGE